VQSPVDSPCSAWVLAVKLPACQTVALHGAGGVRMTDPRPALEAIGQSAPTSKSTSPTRRWQLARVDAPDADWKGARAELSKLARDAVARAGEMPSDDLAKRAATLAG